MKKLLLTLAGAAALSFSSYAETVTINVDDAADVQGTFIEEVKKDDGSVQAAAHYQPLESLKLGDFTFSFTTTNTSATSAPAYYYATSIAANQQKTIRIYAGTSMTITAPEGVTMTEITTKGSNGKANAAWTVDNGTWTCTTASATTWTGAANKITVTATGSYRITEITITTGEGGSVDPTPSDKTSITYLASSDAELQSGWTIDNGTLPEGLTYVWNWRTYDGAGYLNAGAYVNNVAYATEAYAISPVIDLSKMTNVSASFEHAAKFQTTLKELCKFLVREEGATAWTELTIPTWPTAGAWTFANSGDIDLKAYDGKKIQLAFKYGSSAAGADTWEIRNLIIAGEGEGVTPPTPTVETAKYALATTMTDGKYLFAIDGKAGSNIAESLSYGRFGLTDKNVTVDGNNITAPKDYAVTITKTDEGYTLVDCFDRFLGMDDEHLTSFQIYTTVNEGCYWTIELSAEGKATIVNVLTECTVSQTQGTEGTFFTNIAPANLNGVEEGAFNLPSLYLLDGSSAVAAVEASENAPVEYFNLQGIRVANPENGIYIRRQGSSVSKVLVK